MPFTVESVVWMGPAKGAAPTIRKAVKAYNEAGAQLLVIHRDTDQKPSQFIIDHHIAPVLADLPGNIRSELPIVPLIIRHEQETWMFADFDKLSDLLGGNLDRRALKLPPNLESRANTKEIMQQAIQMVNKGQTRGRGYKLDLITEQLAKELNLQQLERLPSYQDFIAATTVALRELTYLPPNDK
ncbi:MAG: hypothetical protein ACI81P_000839 [Neolewinella sp.]